MPKGTEASFREGDIPNCQGIECGSPHPARPTYMKDVGVIFTLKRGKNRHCRHAMALLDFWTQLASYLRSFYYLGT